MKITSDLFHAYLKCSTKCWLRATRELATENKYPEWVKAHNHSYRTTEVARLVAASPKSELAHSPNLKDVKTAKWRLPWHNNNAEHAIKAFSKLRDITRGSFTERSIKNDMVLLSICQTCKYSNLDFFEFLRSGATDIYTFAEKLTRRRRLPALRRPVEFSDL